VIFWLPLWFFWKSHELNFDEDEVCEMDRFFEDVMGWGRGCEAGCEAR